MTDLVILNAIKQACMRAGNQLELARRTGLSQGQLSDYICGRRKIKNMTIGTFCRLFPEMAITFFQDQLPKEIDPVDCEIARILRGLTAREKAECLKILAANFSDRILMEYSRDDTMQEGR